MEDGIQSLNVAILSSPGMGHLTPLTEFAKRLVHHHNFSVTLITPSDFSSPPQQTFLEALPNTITSITLPPILLDDLADDVKINIRFCVMMARTLPSLRDVFRTLKKTTRLVAYIADIFGPDTMDVAREFGVPPYLFMPSNFLLLSLMFHLPVLDESTSCEFRDLSEPVKLPGCVPLHGRDLLDALQDRKDGVYPWVLHHARLYREAEGILVNSFEDIEPEAVKILKEKEPGRPVVMPVGPLTQSGSSEGVDADGSGCLKWLDEQPRGSVLFVSFGSGGTLSWEQIQELAMGLEMSGERFLWVIRSPRDMEASANVFSAQSIDDPFEYLPEGFLERTRSVGLVVPSWAPQIQVLSHGSTGGFLSHCGWNSTLESVVNGVPMIAWPLYAEQMMNAVMLVEEVKVALRPRGGENIGGVVGREEISRVVKGLMEGDEGKACRSRVRELQVAGNKALSHDQEGSSYKALTEVVTKWKNYI